MFEPNLKTYIMKKLLYTLLAVSIIFSACKKEDEDPANTNNNNSGNNTVVNNDPSNLIGEWHSEYLSDYDTYFHKITFYSNGDSFHRRYGGGDVQEYNSAYETPNDGFINFDSHSFWPHFDMWSNNSVNYCKYNINGNTLTITDLDSQSIHWDFTYDNYDNTIWMDAIYTRQ